MSFTFCVKSLIAGAVKINYYTDDIRLSIWNPNEALVINKKKIKIYYIHTLPVAIMTLRWCVKYLVLCNLVKPYF